MIGRGLHFGNDHPAMLDWAQLIHELVPSAKKIRYTSSGSEAAMLALRLARAFTGHEQLLRLEDHFNGWHDAVGRGAAPPFDAPVSLGLPRDTVKLVVEAESDLFTEQTLVPAIVAAVSTAVEVVVEAGYPKVEALLELYLSGEMGDIMHEAGYPTFNVVKAALEESPFGRFKREVMGELGLVGERDAAMYREPKEGV